MLVMSSSAVFSLSLLTSDFYGIIISHYVFGYAITVPYGVGFGCVMLGLVVYNT